MTIRISPALTTALAVGLAYPLGARPARAQDAKPMDRPRDLLSVELGSAVTQQRSTAEVANNFVALRMAANYKHRFTEAAYVQQIVEALPDARDFDDTRVNSETALVAPLSSKVAF